MKPVCLIPTWRRPEFLWHCLKNIQRAHGAERYTYLFRVDTGHDPDVLKVIDAFPLGKVVSMTKRTPYQLAKQSYSLLTGYQQAAQMTDSLVVMVEEDVMVRQDFFEFHEQMHAAHSDLFCSIAVANPNRRMTDEGQEDAYYLSGGDYCSIGVAFKPEVLRQVVLPHATSSYYSQPIAHCLKAFPGSPFGQAFAEQDGLIRRIQWKTQFGDHMPIAWPWKARAYHAGFYGKNRGSGPRGTLSERIATVAEVIYSDEAMRTFAKHPEWYEDSRPINLTAPSCPLLHLHPLDQAANGLRF